MGMQIILNQYCFYQQIILILIQTASLVKVYRIFIQNFYKIFIHYFIYFY